MTGCKKCGMDHLGGAKKCPLKGMSNAEAKKRVVQLMKRVATISSKELVMLLKNKSMEE